jgi:shikimate kinase
MKQVMRGEIVLLGPMAVGKTTIARRLARITKVLHLNIDLYKNSYFKDIGYDDYEAENCYTKDGIRGLYGYMKPFELKLLQELLKDNFNCIFDIGAGFIEHTNQNDQKVIFDILDNFINVFLILPHPNIEMSRAILNQRFKKRFISDRHLHEILNSTPGFDLNHYLTDFFYQNKSRFKTIYTNYKSVKQVLSEIIKRIRLV